MLQRFQRTVSDELRSSGLADHDVDDIEQVIDSALGTVRKLLRPNDN